MFLVQCVIDGILINRCKCATIEVAREQATELSDSLAYADSITITNTATGEVEDCM